MILNTVESLQIHPLPGCRKHLIFQLQSVFFIGGAFPFTIGRIEHGFNVRPDLCAVENPVNPRSVLRLTCYDIIFIY